MNIATDHIEDVVEVCRHFLRDLLQDMCPKDVEIRLSSSHLEMAMTSRHQAAMKELNQILDDLREYPINYNHYYTDTVDKCQAERELQSLAACIEKATTHDLLPECRSTHTSASIDFERFSKEFSQNKNPDMDIHSCEKALDGLIAIYKVSPKPFQTSIGLT